MTEPRTVTGHSVVGVRVVDDDGVKAVVYLRRGEALPDNLADGEAKRLEKVGAFDEAPTASFARQGARPVFSQVPDLAPPLEQAPPRLDLLALPPQITLGANPEPEGTEVVTTRPDDAPPPVSHPTPPGPPVAPTVGELGAAKLSRRTQR